VRSLRPEIRARARILSGIDLHQLRITAFLLTAGWMLLRYGVGIEARSLLIPFAACLVVFQTLFFRYARALWLAMDCRFDRSLFRDQPEEATDGRR